MNYRNLFLTLLLLCLSLPAFAQKTLNARIEKGWTVETARKEAFEGVQQWVDLSWANPKDADFRDNVRGACSQGLITYNDRTITNFRDPESYLILAYSVNRNGDNKIYNYSLTGELLAIDFTVFADGVKDYKEQRQKGSYPIKSYKHSYPNGKLLTIWISVSKNDAYGFLPDGKLTSHCVGGACYNASGGITAKREFVTENHKD